MIKLVRDGEYMGFRTVPFDVYLFRLGFIFKFPLETMEYIWEYIPVTIMKLTMGVGGEKTHNSLQLARLSDMVLER